MSAATAVAMNWKVNGLQLAGLSWGVPGARPLLALHGWLDNAASFSTLAPLLNEYHVVAVDLTGHGLSAHRSADAGYQIWDDLPELLGVLDALGWERFSLMGHSRGAIISCVLASAIPQRVERLVLLDGLMPSPVDEAAFPGQLRAFLQDKHYWQRQRNRVFSSVEAAVGSRAGNLPALPVSTQLVTRNLRPCEGGYTWGTDLRLRGASAVKLTGGHIRAVLRALEMPVLLMLSDQGSGKHSESVALAKETIRELDIREVAGGHHFHMESGAAIVAGHIARFLKE